MRSWVVRGHEVGQSVGEDRHGELAWLRGENARLRGLLELSTTEARPPEPAQTTLWHERPGAVTASSTPGEKLSVFSAVFTARRDVYAIRWQNARTGRAGWVPAVAGGWRKGSNRRYCR